jgi:hypothetical protein
LIAVVAPQGVPAALRELLIHVFPFAQPATYEPTVAPRVRACILASVDLLGTVPVAVPTAVWVDETADALRSRHLVAAVLSSDPAVTAAAAPKDILVPKELHPFRDVRPVSVNVRTRLRRARGLPDDAVAVCDDVSARFTWCGHELDRSLTDTALACAAAVVVRGSLLRRAMAWGAPIVTDAASNEAVEAVADRHLIVEDADALGTAQQLANDTVRAAVLSRSARRFYEERFDTSRAVHRLAARLGLAAPPPERPRLALTGLGTPITASCVARAYDLLDPFTRDAQDY